LKATRLTPDIEKNLTQEILGKRLIADKPKKPALDVGPMPDEQSLQRSSAATSRESSACAGSGVLQSTAALSGWPGGVRDGALLVAGVARLATRCD
jgi:hypothetical protein